MQNVIPSASSKFVILDFLRFCTAVLVLVFHFELFILRDSSVAKRYFGALDVGVDLFFVLSGFVIAHNYNNRINTVSDYFHFLRRRLARIYPLHLLMTCVVVVMIAGAYMSGQTIKDSARYQIHYIPGQLGLMHAWGIHDRLSFNHVSWSISAEWFAYLLFPVLMALAVRLGAPLALAGTVLVIGLIEAITAGLGIAPWNQRTYDFGILRALPSFFAGIAVWLIWQRVHPSVKLSAWIVVLLALTALASMFLQPFRNLTIAIFVVLILAGALADHTVPKSLVRPMQLLGDASYGLYMSHTIVGTIFFTVLWGRVPGLSRAPVATAVLAFGVSVFLSLLIFRYFENPLRRRLGSTAR